VKDEEIDVVLRRASETLPDLKPETRQRVAGSIKASVRRVRPLPPTWIITVGLVLVCAAVSLAGAAHAGFDGIRKMDPVERTIVFSTLLALAAAAGAGFVHQMVPGSRRRLSPHALVTIICLLLLGMFALMFRDYHTTHFLSEGIACLLTGVLFALPAGVLSWLLLRGGFAVNPVSAGLIAGTLSGLAGLGMLELHCDNFQAAHLLLWHTAVVPVSGAAGALAAWMFGRQTR
jgi:hypothetical protein